MPNIFAQSEKLYHPRVKSQKPENHLNLKDSHNSKNQEKTNNQIPLSGSLRINTQNAIINVPNDFQTIQAAIDAAVDGDIISVSAGAYKETLTITGKSLTLQGEDKENTIIDGENENELPAILVEGGSLNISGFTVKNGIDGIRVEDSSLSIVSDNIITNNFNSGINYNNAPGEILNNVISKNNRFNESNGDGIRLTGSNFIVKRNNINENASEGLDILDSDGLIEENTISNNKSIGARINRSEIEIFKNLIPELNHPLGG